MDPEIPSPAENITAETTPYDVGTSAPEIRLADVVITDDNVALNVMVAFLDAAQKRGAFSINESSKIWECIQRFIKK
jgi:hypothetical protein